MSNLILRTHAKAERGSSVYLRSRTEPSKPLVPVRPMAAGELFCLCQPSINSRGGVQAVRQAQKQKWLRRLFWFTKGEAR
jgi:hypothetical protein